MESSLSRRQFIARAGAVVLVGGAASAVVPRPALSAAAAKVGEPAPPFHVCGGEGAKGARDLAEPQF